MKKSLGLSDVFAVSAGAMLSSGFFLLPGIAMDETGPSLVLAYALAALLVLAPMASIAELGTAMPRAGGAYFLLDRTLGRLVGTIAGIGTWIQLVLKSSFALFGLGAYLSLLVEVPIRPVAIGLAVAFALLNLRGASEAGWVQRLLVFTMLGVLGFYLLQGGFYVGTGLTGGELEQRYTPFFQSGALGLFSATGLLFVAFTGLTKIASVAEEIERPGRNLPLGMFLAWSSVTVVYILGSAIVVAVVEADALRDDETPIATAGEVFLNWLPEPAGLVAIIVAALAAFASTANAGLLSASRYGLALGRDGVVHSGLAKLGRRGIPGRSVLLSAAAMILAIVLLDVETLAKLASAFQLLVFAFLCSAVIVFRQARRTAYTPRFRAPLYPYLHIAGIIGSLALIPAMGLEATLAAGAIVAFGLAWFFVHARKTAEHRATLDDVLPHTEPS